MGAGPRRGRSALASPIGAIDASDLSWVGPRGPGLYVHPLVSINSLSPHRTPSPPLGKGMTLGKVELHSQPEGAVSWANCAPAPEVTMVLWASFYIFFINFCILKISYSKEFLARVRPRPRIQGRSLSVKEQERTFGGNILYLHSSDGHVIP